MSVVATVMRTAPIDAEHGTRMALLRDYAMLCKVRVLLMVIVVWTGGFYLGLHRTGSFHLSGSFIVALFGISAVAAGASALNQVIERSSDLLMTRTASRPVAQNRLSPAHGVTVGLILIVGGSLLLTLGSNLLSAGLAVITAAGYVAAYTPLKSVSQFNIIVGSIFGALPPLIGWTAATGKIEWPGLALFAVLVVWQLPHIAAIGWLNREDYARAGIRVPASLCDVQAAARSSAIWAVAFAILMIPVSLWAAQLYRVGALSMIVVLGLGMWYLGLALRFAKITRNADADLGIGRARDLLRGSVIYLPMLLLTVLLSAHSARG